MQIDGSGRVQLVQSMPVLRPDEQVLQMMLDGWRNQQLSRNLQFATIDQRLRCVQRFLDHVNEDPWNWTPTMVEEFSADLRTVKHVSHSTLRGYHSALRAFTSYISNPDYGWDRICEKYFGTIPAQVFFDWNTAPTSRSTTAVRLGARTPAKRSARSSTTPTTRSSASASPAARAGRPPTVTRS